MNVFDNFNLVNLELGKTYILTNESGKSVDAILIKTSPKGYGLFNLNANKLLSVNGHLYPSKMKDKGMWFFITKHLKVTEKIEVMREDKKVYVVVNPENNGLKPKAVFEKETNVLRLNDICAAIANAYASRSKIELAWIEEYNELIEKVK